MTKPYALTDEQIEKIRQRSIQNWQIHRDDIEALCAMARERNAQTTPKPVQ